MENYQEQFYKIFDVQKVKFFTPGRDYDENGDLTSWYEEYEYPYLGGEVFFDLLDFADYHEITLFEGFLNKKHTTRFNLIEALCSDLIDAYTQLKEEDSEKAELFKIDLNEIIQDNFIEEE